ncbi:MAG TPA: TauD/TfdA family dioxygenase, partial [Aldersonia sp.]
MSVTIDTPRPTRTVTPFRVQPLTATIGAELFDVDLGEVSRDEALFAELRALLLRHKVLFLRDQDFSRAEHVA